MGVQVPPAALVLYEQVRRRGSVRITANGDANEEGLEGSPAGTYD